MRTGGIACHDLSEANKGLLINRPASACLGFQVTSVSFELFLTDI